MIKTQSISSEKEGISVEHRTTQSLANLRIDHIINLLKDLNVDLNATYSGGAPLRANEVKTISTRWPSPAKKV